MGCIGSKEQGAAYRAPDEQLVAKGGAAKLHGADATASATDTGGKAVVDPLPDATKPAQQQQLQAQQSTQQEQEQEQQQQQQQQADEKAEAKPEPEFQSAPHPETEETRIATLHGLGVLDTVRAVWQWFSQHALISGHLQQCKSHLGEVPRIAMHACAKGFQIHSGLRFGCVCTKLAAAGHTNSLHLLPHLSPETQAAAPLIKKGG